MFGQNFVLFQFNHKRTLWITIPQQIGQLKKNGWIPRNAQSSKTISGRNI